MKLVLGNKLKLNEESEISLFSKFLSASYKKYPKFKMKEIAPDTYYFSYKADRIAKK